MFNPRFTPIAFVLALLGSVVQAQSVPDAGSILRETERQPRALPAQVAPVVPQALEPEGNNAVRVFAKVFEFSGNQLLTQTQLQAVAAPWLEQELSFVQLQQVADAVSQAYRQLGWLATAKLPAQDVSEGTIRFQILEARFGKVQIDDEGKPLRLSPEVAQGIMTARQTTGAALNLDALERSNSLLNDIPGVGAMTVLSAGEQDGSSDVIVKLQDKPLLAAAMQLDNTGSRSTGDSKLSFSGSINNPAGLGEQISLAANGTQGSRYYKAGYTLPVGVDGWRAGVNASTLDYKLVSADLASLKAKGDAQTQGLQLSYPLLRSNLHNVSFSATYDWKTYYNEMNALPVSFKHVESGVLALNGDHIDGWGSGGNTLWGLSVSSGRVDLSGNTNNQIADQAGPATAGHFEKLSANMARLQRLTPRLSLWASVSAQSVNKNLDSSEKMSLGGPTGVRAYPVMEAVGDEGLLATLELRYTLDSQWQLIAFYDQGRLSRDYNASYPGAMELQTVTLAGRGVGVNWSQSNKWSVRGVLAHRNGDNPLANTQNGTDQDGSLKKYRVWLTGVFSF